MKDETLGDKKNFSKWGFKGGSLHVQTLRIYGSQE
jgi:hypothetical protein